MNDFSSLNAVSSGGASGIGLPTVRRLSAGDACVAVLDLDPPSVARPVVAITCDLTDQAFVEGAISEVAFARRGAGSISGTSLAVDGGMQALLVPPVRQ